MIILYSGQETGAGPFTSTCMGSLTRLAAVAIYGTNVMVVM